MRASELLSVGRRLGAVGLMAWTLGAMAATLGAAEDEAEKPSINASHPLYRPLEMAYKSRAALRDLKDYEAVFTKQEVLDRRRKTTTMRIKFREEPFSVYLYFVDPNKGREVIYVEGKNNNQLLVHETGVKAIIGTISLDPKSKDAMAESKYPVTMIGMHKLLEQIIDQWEAEGKFGETSVQYYPDAKLGEVNCTVIESSHPKPRDNFKFQLTRLYFEKETMYPIRVEQYGFPRRNEKQPPLVEEYTYSQIKANPGLADRDFDSANPSYAFPKP
jgi:hypothetical protein